MTACARSSALEIQGTGEAVGCKSADVIMVAFEGARVKP